MQEIFLINLNTKIYYITKIDSENLKLDNNRPNRPKKKIKKSVNFPKCERTMKFELFRPGVDFLLNKGKKIRKLNNAAST